MNLFKGLIKCMNCGRNFNFKNDHGQYIYLCSGYKNYGSKVCQRNVIFEDDLIKIVQLHYHINSRGEHKNLILSEDIINNIDKIYVDGDQISIFYKDGTKSEWNNSHLAI